MTTLSLQHLSAQLASLERLTSTLTMLTSTLATASPTPSLPLVEQIEDLISQTSQLHLTLGFDLQQDHSGKAGKLSRDFARLSPNVQATIKQAQQACFEARHALHQHAQASDPPSHPSPNPFAPAAVRLQEQVLPPSSADAKLSQDTMAEVRRVEERAATVNELAAQLAGVVAHQAAPAAELSALTTNARSDVVSGFNELAELKRREAGKHITRGTSVTALIGGAVGIVGGPLGIAIGAAAGAAVGAMVGSGLTAMSRRSIAREVRSFKEKFAQVKVQPDGSCVSVCELWENQRWSPTSQVWSHANLLPTDQVSKWTDTYDVSVDVRTAPTPDSDLPCVAPRLSLSAKLGSAGDEAVENDLETEPSSVGSPRELDNVYAGKWTWESPWRLDQGRKDSDAAGWSYAFSFSEGSTWTAGALRTSLVRRRRWYRVMSMKQPVHPDEVARVELDKARAGLRFEPDLSPEALAHVARATKHMSEAWQATGASLDELTGRQAQDLAQAAEDAALVLDAAQHAQRVARAATLSGALLNTLTPTPVRPPTAGGGNLARAHTAPARQQQQPPPEATPLDALKGLSGDTLRMSEVMFDEVRKQNEAIEGIANAVDRSRDKVRVLKKL